MDENQYKPTHEEKNAAWESMTDEQKKMSNERLFSKVGEIKGALGEFYNDKLSEEDLKKKGPIHYSEKDLPKIMAFLKQAGVDLAGIEIEIKSDTEAYPDPIYPSQGDAVYGARVSLISDGKEVGKAFYGDSTTEYSY